jgi:phenylpropionate dioxygenase-like ring-hydroxylating dioxygenase large terminal subunit
MTTQVSAIHRDLVMRRDRAGEAHVWEDLCIHRGSRLSKGCIVDDVCPYHGWRYDSTAKCVLIPATPRQPVPTKARAFPYLTAERYGFVWASLGHPLHVIPEFPEWNDAAFTKVHAGPYLWKSSGFRSVENFLDATHFPFVHAGVNGVASDPMRSRLHAGPRHRRDAAARENSARLARRAAPSHRPARAAMLAVAGLA